MSEEAPASELSCYGCGQPLRAQATFCGRCGALQSTLLPPTAHDDFAQAVLREAAAHSGQTRDPHGAVRALIAYAAALAVSLSALVVGKQSVAWDFGAQVVLMLVAAVFVSMRWREHKAAFGAPVLSRATQLVAALGLIGMLALAYLVGRLVPTSEGLLTSAYRSEGAGFGALLLSTAVMPALSEEVLFRVVILGALGRAFQERTAILVSALLFATLHVSPTTFVAHSALGLLLAYLRLRTGSVYPCIALHAAYNAVILAMAW